MSDNPSPLLVAAGLVGSAFVAALVSLLASGLASEKLLGNVTYFISFAAFCALLRRREQHYAAEFVTGFLIFLVLATSAFLYGMAWETETKLLPDLLRGPLDVVGYVSSAPDSWPPLLAVMWAATVLPVTLAALLAGRAAAGLRANRISAEPEDRLG